MERRAGAVGRGNGNAEIFCAKDHDETVSESWALQPSNCRRHLRIKTTMERLANAGILRPYKCQRHIGPKITIQLLKN